MDLVFGLEKFFSSLLWLGIISWSEEMVPFLLNFFPFLLFLSNLIKMNISATFLEPEDSAFKV